MKKSIAFFDFDGTITTKDTLLEFIKYSKGKLLFYIGFFIYAPYLVAYKLKIISNQTAKERIIKFFFGKMPLTDFQKQCDLFMDNRLPKLIRPKATKEIKRLQNIGANVVVVSASPENWIRGWADSMQLQLIATRLEIRKDRITGRIIGRNCYGIEKVKRIQEAYSLDEYDKIYAYGDSSGDKYMMRLANISFFKPFL